jgi:hypothetical protein
MNRTKGLWTTCAIQEKRGCQDELNDMAGQQFRPLKLVTHAA